MRTLNSLKNFITGTGVMLITNLLSFISRTVFISILGKYYLGVNGLLTNLLSMLSLAELGIGSAINFSLYKPLAENDNKKISMLMNFYKKAYRAIGIAVFILGSLMMLFLDILVKDQGDIKNLRLIFMIYVIDTSYSYFLTYKNTLISADQKSYKLASTNVKFNIIMVISQIMILVITKNYILYLLANMFVLLIQRLYVNKKINILYPVLNEKVTENIPKSELNTIVKNVKAMMMHKIGDYCINGTDNMIISAFVSLGTVGLYSNYAMLISMVNGFIMIFFNSITASMGNLIATETKEKRLEVFKILNFIGFWIFGFTAICLFNLLNPFIQLWLGKEYLLSQGIIIVVILNYYLTGMRVPVQTVKAASGLYDEDKYIPIIQSIVNLIVSIILVQQLGMVGVFIGTLVSSLVLPCWHRPYIIYKYTFKASPKDYYRTYILYLLIIILLGLGTSILLNTLINRITIVNFIIMLLICVVISNVVIMIIFYKTKEFRYLQSLFRNIIRRELHKWKKQKELA